MIVNFIVIYLDIKVNASLNFSNRTVVMITLKSDYSVSDITFMCSNERSAT